MRSLSTCWPGAPPPVRPRARARALPPRSHTERLWTLWRSARFPDPPRAFESLREPSRAFEGLREPSRAFESLRKPSKASDSEHMRSAGETRTPGRGGGRAGGRARRGAYEATVEALHLAAPVRQLSTRGRRARALRRHLRALRRLVRVQCLRRCRQLRQRLRAAPLPHARQCRPAGRRARGGSIVSGPPRM